MNEPPWLEVAQREAGQSEVAGSAHNPRIVAYHQTTTLRAQTDEVPWCSSFVNWCMKQAGIRGTGSAAARSWLGWGQSIPSPKLGCVVVFRRGAPPSGHVAFYIGKDTQGRILVLGGNQSNKVNVSAYSTSYLLGYRWPTEREGYHPVPQIRPVPRQEPAIPLPEGPKRAA